MEEWQTVEGFESLYEVSNDGRVRSVPRRVPHGANGAVRDLRGRILTPWAAKKGHGYVAWYVSLSSGGRVVKRKVSHLVLHAFDRPRVGAEVARHLDGDPANNAARNLAWGSYKKNGEDMVAHGTSPAGERNGNARLTNAQAAKIRDAAARGAHAAALAELYGVSRRTVSRVIRCEVYR